MKKKLTLWDLFSVMIFAFFALFILYPLFLILYKSVISGGYRRLFRCSTLPISLQRNFTGAP